MFPKFRGIVFIGVYGAAKPISIGAFGFCVFTITALTGCTLDELLVDFPARLQAKFLRFFRRQLRMNTNKGRNRKPRMIRMTRIPYCEVISDRSLVIGGKFPKAFGAKAYP